MKKLSLLLIIPLTACATLTAESTQKITVTTTPAGAHCTLSNGEGSWEIAKTPASATVKRAFSKLTIACETARHETAATTLEAATRNRAYGNILLAGVPALVDAATGDGYEYESPDVVLALEKPKK